MNPDFLAVNFQVLVVDDDASACGVVDFNLRDRVPITLNEQAVARWISL